MNKKILSVACVILFINFAVFLSFYEKPVQNNVETAVPMEAEMEVIQPYDVRKNLYESVQAEAPREETAETVQEEEAETEDNSEYKNLAIAHVTDYVNVRSEPNTDSSIVGKIYDGAVGQIEEQVGEGTDIWLKILSGNVEGFIKAEYFIYGDEAASIIEDYVTRYATVQADRLNVREEQNQESKRIGFLNCDETVRVVENLGDWIKVSYGGNKEGYVSADYVKLSEEFKHAKTLEEEKAEREALLALAKREQTTEESAPEKKTITLTPPATTYTSNAELRQSIVNYAMQFLGNRYVSGGQSLQSGTDCSGFTCYIYKDFGYNISRIPAGQLSSSGRSIDYSEIQPGDIICYGKSKCTHVAMYIGDGKIIHAANSRKGVVIYNADYDNILGIKNVID